MRLSLILFGLHLLLNRTARKYPLFRERLKEEDLTAQIKVKDDSEGRYYTFRDGQVTSKRGIHRSPDVCMSFLNAELAVKLLLPSRSQQDMIHAMKNFLIELEESS